MKFICQSDEKTSNKYSLGRDVPPHIFLYFYVSPLRVRVSKKRQTAFSAYGYWNEQDHVSQHLCDFSAFHTFC